MQQLNKGVALQIVTYCYFIYLDINFSRYRTPFYFKGIFGIIWINIFPMPKLFLCCFYLLHPRSEHYDVMKHMYYIA